MLYSYSEADRAVAFLPRLIYRVIKPILVLLIFVSGEIVLKAR